MHPSKALTRFALIGAGLLWTSTTVAQAQPATPPTSVGPGRITCQSAKKCDMNVGMPPTALKYKINASALGDADKDRLVKQCTAKATACIATVTGAEKKGVIAAATIKFYN